MSIPLRFEHPAGVATVERVGDARFRITVDLADPVHYMPVRTCETSYPPLLIERILQVKGPAYLCHEILRSEDPRQIQREFEFNLLAFVEPQALAHARILDFACGCGASSAVLCRMFPGAQIVGIDLKGECLEVARLLATHLGATGHQFVPSPSGTELPSGLGSFDVVVMSAVYEHLLPRERTALMPQLWSHLRPGGLLFLNQTPNRLFPLELHTTKLPLINYAPDPMAHWMARRFSRRVRANETWTDLLRRGIRGGSLREILGLLSQGDEAPQNLRPTRLGIHDPIELWFRSSGSMRRARIKRLMKIPLRAVEWSSGAQLVPNLALAIRKPDSGKALEVTPPRP